MKAQGIFFEQMNKWYSLWSSSKAHATSTVLNIEFYCSMRENYIMNYFSNSTMKSVNIGFSSQKKVDISLHFLLSFSKLTFPSSHSYFWVSVFSSCVFFYFTEIVVTTSDLCWPCTSLYASGQWTNHTPNIKPSEAGVHLRKQTLWKGSGSRTCLPPKEHEAISSDRQAQLYRKKPALHDSQNSF